MSDETLAALTRPAEPPSGGVDDLVLHAPTTFSLGNLKPMPGLPSGSSANAAFGHRLASVRT